MGVDPLNIPVTTTKTYLVNGNWVVLSDEQMSKRCPFFLLNDEQMSNWVGVEHLPGKPFKLLGIPYLVGKIIRSNGFFQGPGRLSEKKEYQIWDASWFLPG